MLQLMVSTVDDLAHLSTFFYHLYRHTPMVASRAFTKKKVP